MSRSQPPSAEARQLSALPELLPNQTQLLSNFNIAFSLMSVIPLLTCFYLITAWLEKNNPVFFSIQILEGMNGVYFLLALVIALLGLLAGHQLIRKMFQQLVRTNTKLTKLNEAQAGFVSNVAHEFRAPLSVFKGALDNLADGLYGPLAADQKEPVAMCQQQVDRLTRLVRDLLELARIESGKLRLIQEPVVLQEALTSTGGLFGGLLKQRGLRLTMDLPPEPARVIGDKDRLSQVFVNLLGNSVKYTDVGGVSVRLIKDGGGFQVEVSDTGRGIAEKDLGRVFDKFERVGDQSEEGSGLGLPIAKDIVELHRGRMWVESQLGQGSRFFVWLPADGGSES